LGATTYVSGTGAAAYQKPEDFGDLGVDLAYLLPSRPDSVVKRPETALSLLHDLEKDAVPALRSGFNLIIHDR